MGRRKLFFFSPARFTNIYFSIYIQQNISKKLMATLVGALHGAHLQRHGGVVTLVGPPFGLIDVLPGPRSCHAHLAGTLVGAHFQTDG